MDAQSMDMIKARNAARRQKHQQEMAKGAATIFEVDALVLEVERLMTEIEILEADLQREKERNAQQACAVSEALGVRIGETNVEAAKRLAKEHQWATEEIGRLRAYDCRCPGCFFEFAEPQDMYEHRPLCDGSAAPKMPK